MKSAIRGFSPPEVENDRIMWQWFKGELLNVVGARRSQEAAGAPHARYNVVRSGGMDPFRAAPQLDADTARSEAKKLDRERQNLELQTTRTHGR